MNDWMTLTLADSGLSQRVRKASISVYGTLDGVSYIVREGRMLQVKQSEAELKAALEGEQS